jgi:NAD(P)-dependent dehydrogenase (short-subunit alcohol dehydrogenase family)
MDLGLHGKSALVWAAGGGPGPAIAEALAREAARDGITCSRALPGRVARSRILFRDRASYITGSAIRVDGGLIASL